MAINVGGAGDGQVVSEINTTPLVDVMLVLLIIFLITIPVANYSVPVELPKKRNEVRESTPKDIVISVDSQGAVYWFDARVKNQDDLVTRLKQVSQQVPQPEVHVRGDARGEYAPVGRVIAACQRAGILKLGFITEPPPRG